MIMIGCGGYQQPESPLERDKRIAIEKQEHEDSKWQTPYILGCGTLFWIIVAVYIYRSFK